MLGSYIVFVRDQGYQSISRKLRTFTQLKRNKRFDNFIMLVWVQGSPFHIAAGSHPVHRKPGGLQRSNSKVASMLFKTIQTDSSCYNDSEKV